jgi:hypothetical protein
MVVATLFVMLAVITPAYAGDADGLWYASLPDQSGPLFGMIRVNGGYMLLTFLDDWNWQMPDWFPVFGPFDGTTGNLSLLLTNEANGKIPQALNATFRMTSSTTSTITIDSCINFANQDNCPPNGTVLDLTKIF